jgi:hypothetical protein
MSMGLLLNEDIWHLGGRREIGTGIWLIEAVGGRGLGGDGDGGRWLWSPIVGTRRVIGRIEVRRGRGERKGRQVGQLERFLFSTEGSVYGMRGGLFTVISILRGVCYGRIVGSGRGRVTHLRTTDDKAKAGVHRVNSSFPAPIALVWPLFGSITPRICQQFLTLISIPSLGSSSRATERPDSASHMVLFPGHFLPP